MCGIAGIVSKTKIEASDIKNMNDELNHRGPDGEGFFFSGDFTNDIFIENYSEKPSTDLNIAFSHKRLAIVDLSNLGHQPMSYMDRYWITYNGEIYNYIEIREELKVIGYSFKSNSDTEVILAAYDAWGIECQNKFNGMWAFAIYDNKNGTIFLSRDRFGIKPLYYYQDGSNFIFSSEIKSLIANKKVITSPNVNSILEYFYKGSTEYKKETPFKNIYRFKNSSYFFLDSDNFNRNIEETSFWDYEIDTSNQKYNHKKALEYANEYYDLLKDAVRLRLRADVDVGAALSGGLDSSAIVYLIDEIKKEEKKDYSIETFSTVHSSKETKYCDESFYINMITDELNIKSNQIEPNIQNVPDLHLSVIKHWESPPDGTGMSGINTYELVSKSNVVVTLDGQGADEQQAGYDHYIINYLVHLSIFSLFLESGKLIKLHGLSRYVILGFFINISIKIFGKNFAQKIVKMLSKKDISSHMLSLNEKLKNDSNTGLINLIHYSDSRSMLFSLESRMPFMDYRLVEFTAKIPSVYKIHNGWTKYFARLAFSKKLPKEICWRKDKMGWPMPYKEWFGGELSSWLINSIEGSQFLKEHIYTKMSSEIDLNKVNLKKAIRLLNISVWVKIFFTKD